MLVPQCSHPCGGRAPPALPWQPLPLRGSLGTDKAGTMLAAQQPGSLLGEGKKSSESSHGDQAGEMDWGRRGELPWESSAKPPALHRDLFTASTFFPLVSSCTQASPMCCPSYVPSSSL